MLKHHLGSTTVDL